MIGNNATWHSHFTPQLDPHIVNEIKRQKVLIFWGTRIDGNATLLTNKDLAVNSKFGFQAEFRRVQNAQRNLKNNKDKVILKMIDLREYAMTQTPNKNRDDEEAANKYSTVIDKIITDFLPTTIVLAFSSEEFAQYDLLDLEKPIHQREFNRTYGKLDIIKQMQDSFRLQEVLASKPNFMIFRTKNITQNEVCFLSFITSNCQPGIRASTPLALNEIINVAGNTQETKILIISGSSGDPWVKTSGFTDPFLLAHELYRAACELVGVDPQNEEDDFLPEPIPQTKSTNVSKDALLNNKNYRNMKFLVLNIEHILSKQMLRDFVNEYTYDVYFSLI